MKKILALVLIFSLTILCAVPVCAAGPGVDIAAVNDAINTITKAVGSLDVEGGSGFMNIINGFTSFAAKGAPVFTLINGSVTFMRLIGVMDDPQQEALDSILDAVQSMNERMQSLSGSVTELANMMTKMQATIEFNNRGQKAYNMQSEWRRFSSERMEDKLDDMMVQYTAMLTNGMRSWCKAVPGEDITIYYADTDEGMQPVYTETDNYIVLGKDLLPSSFKWDINTYQDDIKAYIEEALSKAVSEGNTELYTAANMELNAGSISAVASDAVNAIVYKVTCDEINADSYYALSVLEAFNNYCLHLQGNEDGIDAMLKSMYLTHAFEAEISDELIEVCNQMILKTGTYGMFVSNVLGMSDSVRNDQKENFMDTFVAAVDFLKQSKENCVTGYDNYCYVTGSVVAYTEMSFDSSMTIETKQWEDLLFDYQRYEGCKVNPIKVTVYQSNASKYHPIGDDNGLVLMYTLQNNGVSDIHSYLKRIADTQGCADWGKIVTSYGSEKTLLMDDAIGLSEKKIIGNWFSDKNIQSLNNLPDDISNENFKARTKITGSVYDTESAELKTEVVLHANALYGQSKASWVKDEACFAGGPTSIGNFNDSVVRRGSGEKLSYDYSARNQYNVLLSAALVPNVLGYNPIESYSLLQEDLKALNEENAFPVSGTANLVSPYTRLQAVTLLWRNAGCPKVSETENPFTDVSLENQGNNGFNAVLWAYENEITNGVGDNKFNPDGILTKGEWITMIWRQKGKPMALKELSGFTDAKLVPSYFKDAFSWAADRGIITGDSISSEEKMTKETMSLYIYRQNY